MVDLAPQQEVMDSKGNSVSFASTVGTIAVNIPTVAGNRINTIFVRCRNQTPNTVKLFYSIDAGTTFLELLPGEAIMWPLKGSITQIQVKGSVAGVGYEVLLNLDQAGEV